MAQDEKDQVKKSPCPSEIKSGFSYFRTEDRFCKSKKWYQRLRSFFKNEDTDGIILAKSSNNPADEAIYCSKLDLVT